MRRLIVLLVGLVKVHLLFGQQNVFIDRAFWATHPDVITVKEKLASGNDILEMGPGGWDGLVLAIMADCDYETIAFIANQPGIDFNVPLHHSNNYLMWTAYKGNLPVMKLLLEKDSRTDIINSHGQSLLMHVAMSGKPNEELYDLVLANGGDLLNDRDEEGRNIMHVAAGRLPSLSFLKYFTDRGMDIHAVDRHGNGLFHHAVPFGDVKKLKEIVALGVSYAPNAVTGQNAFSFVGTGRGAKVSLELLQYLKSLGLSPQVHTESGITPLHTAARLGLSPEICDFYIQEGLDPSKTDKEGNTPLILASLRGSNEIISYWISENNINAVNKSGESALTQAVAFNSLKVVQLLLSQGADAGIIDTEGRDLLYYLVTLHNGNFKRFEEKLALLSGKGLAFENHPFESALVHAAFKKDSHELLYFLIEKGMDINGRDSEGNTILHYAAMQSKELESIKRLIEKGADPSVTTEFGETVSDLISENEVLGKQNNNLDFLNK